MFAMISTRRRSDTHLHQLPPHLLLKYQQQQEMHKTQHQSPSPVGLPPPAPPAPLRINSDAVALCCEVCLQPHLPSCCPYHCPPAKEQREPVVEGSADFVSLDRWLASLVRVEIGAEEAGRVHEGWKAELDGPERAASRAAFLLTLLYHSSPYDLLRRILALLRIPPPPSPYESNPSVFAAEEEESPRDTHAPTAAEDAEDESSVASSASKRSADVRIVAKDAKSPSSRVSIHSGAQQHASPLPAHLAKPRATVVASEDDPLSCTPAVSSPSSSASAASSHVLSRSTGPHSSASTETSSPSSHSAAAIVPSASSSAPSPRSGARPLGSVSVKQVRAHIRSLSARSNSAASTAPAPTPSSRIAAFQQWHSSKLHLLQLLHAWVITYPQDFCCLPYVVASAVSAPVPLRRPLEELLHRELVSFPPPEWLRVLPWASSAASSVSGELGVAVGSLRGTKTAVSLTPQMVQAMKDTAAALMIEYSQARRAYMGPDEVSPSGDTEISTIVSGGGRDSPVSAASDSAASSASGSAGAVTSPLQLHRASPSPPPPAQGGVSSSPMSTALVVTPNKRGSGMLSPSLTAAATTVPGSAGQLGSPTLAAHHNSWSQTWGNSAVQRNLESSNKLRRMMQADGGSGAAGSAIVASLPLTGRTSISPSGSASSMQAALVQLQTKTTSEFLAVAPRSYAAALTWLAIMRLEEIGNCAREDAGAATAGAGSGGGSSNGTPSSTTRSLTPVQQQSPLSPPCAVPSCRMSHHHPAPLSSPAFLRLFLRMPAWLSRAQMRMSNTMSCFVASTILRAPNVPQRKAVIKHWLEIAQACLEQPLGDLTNPIVTARASTSGAASLASQLATGPNAQYTNPNFMHAFEIIYGINHQSVYRLPASQVGPDGKMGSGHRGSILGALTGGSSKEPTLPLLHKRNFLSNASYEIYTRLTKLTSPNGNYKDYRRALSEAQAALPIETASPLLSHAAAQGGRFYIPYLGILLKDLVGLEDAGKPLAGMAVATEEGSTDTAAMEEDDECSTSTSKTGVSAPNSIPSTNQASVLMRSASIVGETASSVAENTAAVSEDSDDEVHPTGSLPWDDSFLARPRRNATVVLRPPFLPPPVFGAVAPAVVTASSTSAGFVHTTTLPARARLAGGGGGVLSQLQEETDEELFAAPSPSPTLVRHPSPAVLPGPGTMSPLSQGPLQPQVSDRSLWLDNEKRNSLLSMLTDGARTGENSAGSSPGSSFAPFLQTPPLSPSQRNNRPRMSLLTAALPPRRTVAPSFSVAAATRASTRSPSTTEASALDSTSLGESGAGSSLLLLNYSKLTKIAAIADSTLRCRAFFPVPPPDDFTAQFPPPLDLQREQQAAFGSVLAQAALTSHISDELQSSALSVASALPRRAEPSAAIFSLPFDRRVQHWLVSSMLTYTLMEESQLMDKSYTLYPRKIAGNAGKGGAKLSIAE